MENDISVNILKKIKIVIKVEKNGGNFGECQKKK